MSTKEVPETWGVINLTFTRPGQEEKIRKTVEGYDLIRYFDDYFSFSVNTKVDGNSYYVATKVVYDLNVGETYILTGADKPVWAQLEYNNIEVDKNADGKFILTRGGRYPKGEFYFIEEEAFEVTGYFDFESFTKKNP
ncbi:hypothetical protein GIW70_10175 [Pseudomonas syringae]|nr:hypothetical protein [Pseudomonas syringae]MCF5068566.1 hypothetical protein [Pseudomonas syringae]